LLRKRKKEKQEDSKTEKEEFSNKEGKFKPIPSDQINIDEKKAKGLLLLVKINEEVKVEQDHDVNVKSIEYNGNLIVQNPSKVDRTWDIQLHLSNIEKTTLETSEISIQELGTEDDNNKHVQEFHLIGDVKNPLLIKEYINSSPHAGEILNFKDIETDLLKLRNKIITIKKETEMQEPTIKAEEGIKVEEVIKAEEIIKAEGILKPEGIVESKSKEQEIVITREEKEKKEDISPKEEIPTKKEDMSLEKEKQEPTENVEKRMEAWLEQLKYHRKTGQDLDTDKEETGSEDGGIETMNQVLESFIISRDRSNQVVIVIAMINSYEKPIDEISLVKKIPPEFQSMKLIDTSTGTAKVENDTLTWIIEELSPGITGFLKFETNIQTSSFKAIKTGPIEVRYSAGSSFVEGLKIEKFEALTHNKFYIDMIEREEEPGFWDCNLVFENPSEFILELYDASVHSPEEDTRNFVEIDPKNVPILSAESKWNSDVWLYENIEYPSFIKKLDFRVKPEFEIGVKGFVFVHEAEFILASIGGEIIYELEEALRELPTEKVERNIIMIPSYKITDVKATMKMINNGSVALNELMLQHEYFTEIFQSPKFDEMKLSWNGKLVELHPENVLIEETYPASLKIVLKDLKNSPMGMFEPNSVIELVHPIHVFKPPLDATFESEVLYKANTFPISQELEYRPEPGAIPKIQVVHVRRKYRLGKEIRPIGVAGNYEITLIMENIGNSPLKEFILLDQVPENFTSSEFSMEPKLVKEDGMDVLQWSLESIEAKDKLKIKYEIHGTGEYHPSDAQLAF